jgi:hypothetical protein
MEDTEMIIVEDNNFLECPEKKLAQASGILFLEW